MAANKTLTSFAKHIDKLRRDRDLSFNQMALACDMEKSQVYNICTKGTDLRLSSIIKISKGLEVSMHDIVDFKY